MSAKVRLLIIDDDHELCELLVDYLGSAGFDVDAANEVEEGIRRALSGQYAVAVLDVMLPGKDGFEALKQIRAQSQMPVLMLTARGEEVDRVVGLEIGADDYLAKPFSPRELAARIRAVLRRSDRTDSTGAASREPVVRVGDLVLDPAARVIECSGRVVNLTSTEFDILEALARSAGRVVTRDELSRTVFDRRLFPEDRGIDVHISNLRRKLGQRVGDGERIKTLRGKGYIYALAPQSAEDVPRVSG